MNPAFLLLSALLLFTPAANSASWHTLQTRAPATLQAGEPLLETVDKNATEQEKKKDRKLKVWHKINHSRPQQADPGDFYYTTTKSLTEINCTTRTLKPLQSIYYDGDDNEIKSIRHNANERSEVVVPDTDGESVFNFACTFKAAKPPSKAASRPKTGQTAPQAAKDKTKEASKTPVAASTKTPPKPSPAAPAAKPGETKKTP